MRIITRKDPSDRSNEQWRIIQKLLPPRSRRGRPPIDRRRVIDAVLYVLRSGCQWRRLPRDFPNWSTVYGIFRKWRRDGTWRRIHDTVREKTRKLAGKKPTPTTAIVDSQSIRTAEGGEERGYDAAKKITGRKRHLVVDTLGLVLAVVVHGAYWHDHDGACFVMNAMEGSASASKADLCRLGIQSKSVSRLGSRNLWLGATDRAPSRRCQRIRGAAQALDRRANIRLVGPLPPPQQRL